MGSSSKGKGGFGKGKGKEKESGVSGLGKEEDSVRSPKEKARVQSQKVSTVCTLTRSWMLQKELRTHPQDEVRRRPRIPHQHTS